MGHKGGQRVGLGYSFLFFAFFLFSSISSSPLAECDDVQSELNRPMDSFRGSKLLLGGVSSFSLEDFSIITLSEEQWDIRMADFPVCERPPRLSLI